MTPLDRWKVDVHRPSRGRWLATIYRLNRLDTDQEIWGVEECVQAPTEKKLLRGVKKRIRRILDVEATKYSFEITEGELNDLV